MQTKSLFENPGETLIAACYAPKSCNPHYFPTPELPEPPVIVISRRGDNGSFNGPLIMRATVVD